MLIVIFFSTITICFILTRRHQKQLKKQTLTYETFQNKLIKKNSWDEKNNHKSRIKKRSHISQKITKKKSVNKNSALSKIPDVDFDSLKKYNKDIYAWIQIPKINLSYPVLQHKKYDYYYLTHNIDNSFGYPGCIFSETNSKKDFSDTLTVLYGHNMKNGSMFGMLHHFDNFNFSYNPCFINIITPTSKIRYRILTSAIWGTKNITDTFGNSLYGSMLFFNSITPNCSIKNTLKIKQHISDVHSNMLVLSTCGANNNSRFLIISLKQNEWRK